MSIIPNTTNPGEPLVGTSVLSTLENSGNVINLYVLTKGPDGYLAKCPYTLKYNLRQYLDRYRILTEQINIVDPYIINFEIRYVVTIYSNFNQGEVIYNCNQAILNFFNQDKWEINQDINISELSKEIINIDGVKVVNEIRFKPKYGDGYSNVVFNFAVQNSIIYAPEESSIFELKNPKDNIIGKAIIG